MSDIIKLKSDAKALIDDISDSRVLNSIVNIVDNELFLNHLKKEYNISPVWVLIRVHISQIGNRYLTDVAFASKDKIKVANYMFKNTGLLFEKKIIFVEFGASEITYVLSKNGLGYFNFGYFLLSPDVDFSKYELPDNQILKIVLS
jgi:hypothetical protein